MTVVCVLQLFVGFAGAEASAHDHEKTLAILRGMLEQSEARIDLAETKVKVDRLIEPSIDARYTLSRLDGMARHVEAMFPPLATAPVKMETLMAFLYRPGPWNNNRPFSYDLDDPFGTIIRNKLISTYLDVRKGNCVSMPTLIVILGQKLGINVALATTPEHLYAVFRDESGRATNVEATTGGYRLDSSYVRDFAMTKEALDNGLYMRALSKREMVAEIIHLMLEHYQPHPKKRMSVAKLLLEFYPKDILAMLSIGASHAQMIDLEFRRRYKSPADIPPSAAPRYLELSRENELWYKKAEALGWREPSDKEKARYEESVKQAQQRTGVPKQ